MTTPTPDADAVAACDHAVIQAWRTEDGVVRLWACADCRLRFHPATLARRSERDALVAALEELREAANRYRQDVAQANEYLNQDLPSAKALVFALGKARAAIEASEAEASAAGRP